MTPPLLLIASATIATNPGHLASHPDLGKPQGGCTAASGGRRSVVQVSGLKDRGGRLRLELYPAEDGDFPADDNTLLNAGKTFARAGQALPATGPVELCIRAPRAGRCAISLLHDRDADRRFTLSRDGIGFAGNPVLHRSKPSATCASAVVGDGPRHMPIVLNYRRGILSFAPLHH